MVKKKKNVEETAEITEPVVVESAPKNGLRASLEEIKTYEGVIGYILRNSTSASIDLKDPSKIIDYAILSSAALDAGQELSTLFDLGEVRDIVIEGGNTKVLSLIHGEDKIGIFVEKNADCERILRKLHSP